MGNINNDDLEEQEIFSNGMSVELLIISHAQHELKIRIAVISMILLCSVGYALHIIHMILFMNKLLS